jgi:hypothetical protein
VRYELRDDVDGVWRKTDLVRIDDDGTKTVLGSDAMEPEDALFTRDLAWVPEELNRLAALVDEHKRMRRANGTSLQHASQELVETRKRLGAKIAELQGYLREALDEKEQLRAELQRVYEVNHTNATLLKECQERGGELA